MYSSGQTLHPAYEGWRPNADGSFTMVFGYMNANWQQEFDIPIGPQNAIEPGGPDQGQPTHFYPRRNPFLFTVRVPADFGTKELIWTLTANGKTEKAYASLKSDYQIDPQVISTEVGGDFGSLRDELRTNKPPDLSVVGDQAQREGRRAAHAGRGGEGSGQHSRPARIAPSRCRKGSRRRSRPRRSIVRRRRSSRRAGRACGSRGSSIAATPAR